MTTNLVSNKSQQEELNVQELAMKELEIREREFTVHQKLINEEVREDDKMLMEKIKTISSLLTDSQVDEEKSVFGGETQYKPVFNDVQQEELRLLVLKLAKQLVNR